jgi:hydroxyacylglutathione hydrolase
MIIQRHEVGQMQANCYFLIQDSECLIIDPGDDADFLLEEVSRQNLHVIAIIATHGHFDHVMAAGQLQISLGVPFYIHTEDRFLLKRLSDTAAHFLEDAPIILEPQIVTNITSGMHEFGPFRFEVFEVPGHTPGCICLYFKNKNVLFTGDTLFREGIGRYDFSYSNKKKLMHSLQFIAKHFPPETEVYSGHGEITSIEEESEAITKMAEFLRIR